MKIIYIYVLNTMADWELGNVTSELKSGRFFKKDAQAISLKTVSLSREPISTMGGLTIIPDCQVNDIVVDEKNVLLLPGADTWNDPKHNAVMEKASELLSIGATVCAICGATVALANIGALDNRSHTSNGPGYLEMASPCYKGKDFYVDEPSVVDNNLITARGTGALLWAKHIIEHLGVFEVNTLDAWYKFFYTGKPEYFFELMLTLPSSFEA